MLVQDQQTTHVDETNSQPNYIAGEAGDDVAHREEQGNGGTAIQMENGAPVTRRNICEEPRETLPTSWDMAGDSGYYWTTQHGTGRRMRSSEWKVEYEIEVQLDNIPGETNPSYSTMDEHLGLICGAAKNVASTKRKEMWENTPTGRHTFMQFKFKGGRKPTPAMQAWWDKVDANGGYFSLVLNPTTGSVGVARYIRRLERSQTSTWYKHRIEMDVYTEQAEVITQLLVHAVIPGMTPTDWDTDELSERELGFRWEQLQAMKGDAGFAVNMYKKKVAGQHKQAVMMKFPDQALETDEMRADPFRTEKKMVKSYATIVISCATHIHKVNLYKLLKDDTKMCTMLKHGYGIPHIEGQTAHRPEIDWESTALFVCGTPFGTNRSSGGRRHRPSQVGHRFLLQECDANVNWAVGGWTEQSNKQHVANELTNMLQASPNPEVNEQDVVQSEVHAWEAADGAPDWAYYHGVRRVTFQSKEAKEHIVTYAGQLYEKGVEIVTKEQFVLNWRQGGYCFIFSDSKKDVNRIPSQRSGVHKQKKATTAPRRHAPTTDEAEFPSLPGTAINRPNQWNQGSASTAPATEREQRLEARVLALEREIQQIKASQQTDKTLTEEDITHLVEQTTQRQYRLQMQEMTETMSERLLGLEDRIADKIARSAQVQQEQMQRMIEGFLNPTVSPRRWYNIESDDEIHEDGQVYVDGPVGPERTTGTSHKRGGESVDRDEVAGACAEKGESTKRPAKGSGQRPSDRE